MGVTPWEASNSLAAAFCSTPSSYRGVRHFDRDRGLIEVESGIQWPELIAWLVEQPGRLGARSGAIRQKQTGADRLSIGGAVVVERAWPRPNAAPFVSDVESLTLDRRRRRAAPMQPDARTRELFRLVCGGYGLFGFVDTVTLRLVPRHKVRRAVEIETADRLIDRFDDRIADGYTFGDFQFALDPGLARFSASAGSSRATSRSMRPHAHSRTAARAIARRLEEAALACTLRQAGCLGRLRRTLPRQPTVRCTGRIRISSARTSTTITHGSTTRRSSPHPATEIISELYVPRAALADFLAEAADDFRGTRRRLYLRNYPVDRTGRRDAS